MEGRIQRRQKQTGQVLKLGDLKPITLVSARPGHGLVSHGVEV